MVHSHWATELVCRSIAHSLTHSCIRSVIHSHCCSDNDLICQTLTHFFLASESLVISHWVTELICQSLAHSLNHSLIHAWVHNLIQSFKFKISDFPFLSFYYWPQLLLGSICCKPHGDNSCDWLESLLKIKQKSCHPKCYSIQYNSVIFRRMPTAWTSRTRLSSPFRLHLEPC